MSEAATTPAETEFDARRYIDDRDYRARFDAQEWQRRGPEWMAHLEAVRQRRAALREWYDAGMRQERREELARRFGIVPHRSGPAQVVSIATRQPI